MNTLSIIGGQWGDEGKGKLADLLSKDADWVVRFNGGPNAGHTVVDEKGEFRFHHLPSAGLRKDCKVLLGPGMVIDPMELVEEIEQLQHQREVKPNIYLGSRTHVITPFHPAVERLEKSKSDLGTTGKGIGPAYQDKVARKGFRVIDLLQDDFPERFKDRLRELQDLWKNREQLRQLRIDDFLEAIHKLKRSVAEDRIINSPYVLNQAIEEGKSVIFEGAQGSLLDLDFGTYPFVTSSNPTIGGIASGAGVPTSKVNRRLGVIKAYTTRVGKGPMPTEETGKVGEKLREKGDEYGTTTGRPRRCGFLDLLAAKHAIQINDLNEIALTKLDVLTGFEEVKVADYYFENGDELTEFPSSCQVLSRCEPHYISFEGWDSDISRVKDIDNLPTAARGFVDFLEGELEVPISIVSVGKKRSQTIIVE